MVLPRKTKRQETKVLEEHFFHACNLTSPILMVALLLRELAFFKTLLNFKLQIAAAEEESSLASGEAAENKL